LIRWASLPEEKRQSFVDRTALSAYALSGTPPGKRGPSGGS
jgi:hypothetical protein